MMKKGPQELSYSIKQDGTAKRRLIVMVIVVVVLLKVVGAIVVAVVITEGDSSEATLSSSNSTLGWVADFSTYSSSAYHTRSPLAHLLRRQPALSAYKTAVWPCHLTEALSRELPMAKM